MKTIYFFALALFLALNFNANAQMVTIYENGPTTNDSIWTDFTIIGWGTYLSSDTTLGPIHTIYNYKNGYGFDCEIRGFNFATDDLIKNNSFDPNYGYLEFYIDYTLSHPNSSLYIVTSDSMSVDNPIHSFGSPPPGVYIHGNLVESNPLTMTPIPYYNTFHDSILKIQTYSETIDSAYI